MIWSVAFLWRFFHLHLFDARAQSTQYVWFPQLSHQRSSCFLSWRGEVDWEDHGKTRGFVFIWGTVKCWRVSLQQTHQIYDLILLCIYLIVSTRDTCSGSQQQFNCLHESLASSQVQRWLTIAVLSGNELWAVKFLKMEVKQICSSPLKR